MKPLTFSSPVHYWLALAFNLAVSAGATAYGQTLQDYEIKENLKKDSLISALQGQDKLKFLSLAPSVSYSANTGVNVGFSLSTFTNYLQTKKRNKIEIARLESVLDDKIKTSVQGAIIERMEIFNEVEKLHLAFEILSHYKTLYEISYLSHVNKELTFREFTLQKIDYIKRLSEASIKIKSLEVQLLEYKNKYNVQLFNLEELKKTAKTYEIDNKN